MCLRALLSYNSKKSYNVAKNGHKFLNPLHAVCGTLMAGLGKSANVRLRKQMRGRAGRKGKDTFGENYLCCRKEDLEPVKGILSAGMPSVKSCLGKENQGLKR
jgi:hypothetical protein